VPPEALTRLPVGDWLLVAAAKSEVAVNPDPNGLPGMPEATRLVNGLAAAVLLACVAGFLLGVGQWVLGSKTSNFSQADSGR
jgi:type IV secretory pathway TrbD component